jgi:hypothetical protein
VVCSDIPAFREVGGGHCLFVPLRGDAEEALANGIVAALAQPVQPPILLPQLSAPVLAEQYISLYRRLLAANPLTKSAALSAPLQATSERQAH